jgi:hypothetical protein
MSGKATEQDNWSSPDPTLSIKKFIFTFHQPTMDMAAIAVPEARAGEAPQEKRGTKRAREEPSPQPRAPRANSEQDDAVQRLLNQPPADQQNRGSPEGETEFYRRKIILKLKAWGAAFSDIAGEILKSKDLETLDTRHLEILLNEVKFAVATRTSGIVTQGFAGTALVAGEGLISANTTLKVAGPAVKLQQLANTKDYQDLVKELTLEYADWIYQHPLNRFAAFMVHRVFTIHSINTAAEAQEPAQKKQRTEVEERTEQEAPTPTVRPSVVIADDEAPPHQVAQVPVEGVHPGIERDESGFEVARQPEQRLRVTSAVKPKPAPRHPPAGRGK